MNPFGTRFTNGQVDKVSAFEEYGLPTSGTRVNLDCLMRKYWAMIVGSPVLCFGDGADTLQPVGLIIRGI